MTSKGSVFRNFAPVLAIAAALGGCGGKKQNQAPPPPEAGYIVVREEPVALPVTLTGRVNPLEVSEVRPQVSGVILARNFTEGGFVRQGQTLYQIDPSLYRASAGQAQANLAAAQATAAAAATSAQRLGPLARIQAVAQQDYTNAVAQARQTSANVQQQRAALQTANINLRFTRVPAPISGRIGRSLVTVGGLVTANQADALATIQRLDPVYVDIQQSSTDLLKLRQSLASGGSVPTTAQVKLQLEDGQTYQYSGTLQFAESVVDPTTGSVTLRARFPNPQNLLLPGTFVRATIVQAQLPRAILLPQGAVTRSPTGQATVLVVNGNKAVQRTITADRTLGDKFVVTGGLQPGDKVITEGLVRIKPGQPIRPVPAGSPPQRPGGAGNAGGPGGQGSGGGGQSSSAGQTAGGSGPR